MPDSSPPTAAADQLYPLSGVQVLADRSVTVRFDDRIFQEAYKAGYALHPAAFAEVSTRSLEAHFKRIRRANWEFFRLAAVRKMPVTGFVDVSFYRELLDSIEPSLCLPAAGDPPSVAFISLKISLPPEHDIRQGSCDAFIESHHKSCFLLSFAAHRYGHAPTFFFMVYDILARSFAFVPPAPYYTRDGPASDIPSELALLRCGGGAFVLAQLRLCVDRMSKFPTNNCTLLTWLGSHGSDPQSGQWIKKEEVLLSLPVAKHPITGKAYCSFVSDMTLAIGSTALCWVDLVKGLLIYRMHKREFHFIPLPKDCVTERGEVAPKEYRFVCCIQGQGQRLKFACIEGISQEDFLLNEVTLITWTLVHPLHPDRWAWNKDEASFHLRDLYEHPVYKDELKLQPLPPCYPVISTVKPSVIYLSFVDIELNHKEHTGELKGVHVLSVDMDSHRVLSAFKGPLYGEPDVIPFTYNFSSCKNKNQGKSMSMARIKHKRLTERISTFFRKYKLAKSGRGSSFVQAANWEQGKWRSYGLIIHPIHSSKIGLQCVLD